MRTILIIIATILLTLTGSYVWFHYYYKSLPKQIEFKNDKERVSGFGNYINYDLKFKNLTGNIETDTVVYNFLTNELSPTDIGDDSINKLHRFTLNQTVYGLLENPGLYKGVKLIFKSMDSVEQYIIYTDFGAPGEITTSYLYEDRFISKDGHRICDSLTKVLKTSRPVKYLINRYWTDEKRTGVCASADLLIEFPYSISRNHVADEFQSLGKNIGTCFYKDVLKDTAYYKHLTVKFVESCSIEESKNPDAQCNGVKYTTTLRGFNLR